MTEIDRVVQFLRANDALAQAVGASGRRFALEHLNLEARQCYTKVGGCGGHVVNGSATAAAGP